MEYSVTISIVSIHIMKYVDQILLQKQAYIAFHVTFECQILLQFFVLMPRE